MIIAKVELKPSPIHGTGVYAAEEIAKGEIVWYFSRIFDRVVPEHLWVRASIQEKDKLFERGYRYPDYPDAIYMCGDEGQFLNFPNGEAESNLVLGPMVNDHPVLQARRDIRIGEELTVPPESDADYERKTGKIIEIQKLSHEMPSVEEIESTPQKEPEEGLPQGVRDGEDV